MHPALTKLASIEQAATKGPWVVVEGDDEYCSSISGVVAKSVLVGINHDGRGDFPESMPWIAVSPGCGDVAVDENNFDSIAAARNALPALIAALVEIESITHGNEWLQLKIQEIIATHLEPLK